ncbi:hypothetical protein ACFFJ7_19455 [Pseudochelatococcus lubricantis]|uniref:hypothetical protein n=1 Tax=Pseudochelatococcus lubricantis TaxID=1538102 RepID=UPI0035EA5725
MKMKASGGINLKALFASAREQSSVSETSDGTLPLVRLCLAVRGWVEPTGLARELAGDGAAKAIAALASEVETAAATRAGQWFMNVEARRQAIAGAAGSDLVRALSVHTGSDGQDMILRAARLALDEKPVDLAALSDGALRALANVRDWVGDRWRQSFDREEINATLASKVLDRDLARMTSLPLVGVVHKQVLEKLRRFASEKNVAGLRAVYVHATGGGGKTTLLAFLQRALLAKPGVVAFARIDFDEPGIDAARMITLNLALFEQLASSLPQIRDHIGSFLPQLRGAASALRISDYASQLPLAGWSSHERGRGSLMGQRQVSESVSDQASILYGLLAPENLDGPLVLVLDTAELVMEGSVRAAVGIADWLEFLSAEVQARDIRLIVAGRDPPPEQSLSPSDAPNLLTRLTQIGVTFNPPEALPELNPAESAELLLNCGLSDPRLRQAAAEAVPGNPLLLRITADALQQGDSKLSNEVHEAHAKARVDHQSARTYLMRRVIAHVSDPLVRPYIISAMASPILTSAMLGAVIIPLVDSDGVNSAVKSQPTFSSTPVEEKADAGARRIGRRRLHRIYAGIERTTWLGRSSPDGRCFTFNRDLRRFVMTLVAAVPEDRALHERTHEALLAYHARRRDPLDWALAFFHRSVLGREATLPRGNKALTILRALVDQFPEDIADVVVSEIDALLLSRQRTSMQERALAEPSGDHDGPTEVMKWLEGAVTPTAFETVQVVSSDPRTGDRDWRFHLEGRLGKPGQGDQLVGDDRAAEALAMYRERPTREPGLPPTFVIQALADLGQWDGGDVDVQAIVTEVLHTLSPRNVNAGIERAYWLTRYALQRDPGKLLPAHVELLNKCVNYLKGPGLATFPPLLAVVEALSGERILPSRMITSVQGNEGEGRIYLARRQRMSRELAAGLFAVTQHDWLNRVLQTRALPNADALAGIQRQLNDLHGQPIAMVNQQFLRFRQAFDVQWNGDDMPAGVLLLRGMTAEFLRPLREMLAGVAAEKGVETLRPSIDRTIAAMTIRPAEMEPAVFHERLAANPRAWLSAFISYADRSRLLPIFCEDIAAIFGNTGDAGSNPARVARSFLAWDKALGGPSDWRLIR